MQLQPPPSRARAGAAAGLPLAVQPGVLARVGARVELYSKAGGRMRVRRGHLFVACAAVLAQAGLQSAPSQSTAPATAAPSRAFVNTYCATCHNQRVKAGGLALDTLDLSDVGAHGAEWEKVVVKLRAGLMPPAGMPRPERSVIDSFAGSLEAALDRAAAARPDPGRTEPFHRLNRAEYQNAIRDLLALDVDATAWLPTDEISYGFDNIAGVLKL